MKTIEEKAVAHADGILSDMVDKYQNAPWNEFRDALAKVYIAGTTEALAEQWRKVDDELPEMRQRVLICLKERNATRTSIVISKRIPFASDNPDNPRWEWSNVREEDVIAWMPLPEPPKAEKL